MSARVLPLAEARTNQSGPAWPLGGLLVGRLERVDENGILVVDLPGLGEQRVAWLESADNCAVRLIRGDQLLVAAPQGSTSAIALGRIGRYVSPTAADQLTIEAAECLTLKCGEASIDLRADGKVMIRGEDVLVRVKGTQRIRAGTVSIN